MSRKPYTPHMPNSWWLKRPFYVRYMMRELSSFFVGTYTALLIVGLWTLTQGPDSWYGFLGFLTRPAVIVYQLIALGFTLYHTITWFALAPRSAPVMIGEDFVKPKPIILGQYAAWAAASVIVLVAVAI